jgi:4-amino-4-deoxy-L-arabinose transferase-like glycosyltransferase
MRNGLASFPARLAMIAAAGLAVRVAYTLALAREADGIGDFFYYHGVANLLGDGHGFVHPIFFAEDGTEVATAEHPPLWPFLLGAVSALGGDGFTAHRLTGCVVGAVAIVVIGLLARRVAGDRAGLVSAGIAAAYPTLVAADGSLMSESLYGLLIAASLLAALELTSRPRTSTAAALGALIGLAALTRAEALLLLPLLALPVAWLGRRHRPAWGLRFMLVCAVAALVIAPWAARNWIVFDQPVLISINDSSVIGGANCASAYSGPDIGFWRLDCLAPRERAGNEAVQAERWRDDGIDYARDHAGRLPLVGLVRALRTWDLYQPNRQVGFAEGRDRNVQRAGTAVYYLLLLVAAYGVALLRRRPQALVVLLAPAVLVTLSSVAGFGMPRFRHAAEIPLVVLAGVAVTQLAGRLAAGRSPAGRPGVRWSA